MKHEEQRVLVLFDVQNMYYSAKQLYHAKVNFNEILKKAVSGRALVRAIAYVIKTDIKEEVNFHEALNKMGIEVKAKDLQIFFGGAKKGDWDIGIAMDAVRLSPKVDTVVLVSGDGDFKDLLQYLQSHGCRAEVISFGRTSSKFLKDVADDFVDMEKEPHKYLINYRSSNRPVDKPFKKEFSVKTTFSQTGSVGPSASSLPKINASEPANESFGATKSSGYVELSHVGSDFGLDDEYSGNAEHVSSEQKETKQPETESKEADKDKKKSFGFVKKIASKLKKK